MVILSIAKATIGDALRKKVLQIFLVVAIGLIIISLSFSQTLSFSTRGGAGADLMIVKSMGLGLMAIAGWLISLVMGVSLIPQEIERRTIYTILAKPVKRYEFIIGKYLGALGTLLINIGLMGIVFIIVIMVKAYGAEVPTSTPSTEINAPGMQAIGIFDMNMVWGVIMIYLQFMVLSSVVLLFSVLLTPTVNFFAGLGVYIVGLMAPMVQTLAKSEKAPAILKSFYWGVYYAIPNIEKFNILTSPLLHPETGIVDPMVYTGRMALYALFYSLIMMVVTVIIFERKEV